MTQQTSGNLSPHQAFTTSSLHDLAAQFATRVGCGVNVGVPEPALQVGDLTVGQCRRAFERTVERLAFFRDPDRDTGVLAGFGRAVKMRGGGRTGETGESAFPT